MLSGEEARVPDEEGPRICVSLECSGVVLPKSQIVGEVHQDVRRSWFRKQILGLPWGVLRSSGQLRRARLHL